MTDMSQANDGAGGGQTTGDKLKQQFQTFKGQAGDKARDMAGQGKDKATGALDDAAKFLHETARTIEEKVGPQYGGYVHSAAQQVEGFSGNIRDKDVEELLEQGRDLVRKSPAVAIGLAAGLGFVLARLIKSGIDYTPTETTGSQGFSSSGTSSGMGTTGSTGSLGGTGSMGSTGTGTTGTTGTGLGATSTSGSTGATGLGSSTGTGSSGLPTGGTSVTGSTEPTFPA